MNTKKSLIVLTIVSLFICLGLTELVLRLFLGLGTPPLYEHNPLYGSRLKANQDVYRQNNTRIQTNNLGLRTQEYWDTDISNKILFLGDSVTYGGSYIDNSELFTEHLNQEFSNYQVGNAGINGWGIQNIFGLVIESEFQPTSIYVTVLIEADFYRELSPSYGWHHAPKLAVIELAHHYFLKGFAWLSKRLTPQDETPLDHQKKREKNLAISLRKLELLDTHLKTKGYQHIVIISPKKSQLGSGTHTSEIVEPLSQTQIKTIFLKDHIDPLNLSEKEIDTLFYDKVHLEKEGHALWAELIKNIMQEHLIL